MKIRNACGSKGPVDWKRRWVLRGILALGALGLTGRWQAALARVVGLRLDDVEELQKVGGWVVLELRGRQVLLARVGENEIRAWSAVCTHEQNIVQYDPASRLIRCPVHFSVYDLEGKNIEGPAPEPLDRYATRLFPDGRIGVRLE